MPSGKGQVDPPAPESPVWLPGASTANRGSGAVSPGLHGALPKVRELHKSGPHFGGDAGSLYNAATLIQQSLAVPGLASPGKVRACLLSPP